MYLTNEMRTSQNRQDISSYKSFSQCARLDDVDHYVQCLEFAPFGLGPPTNGCAYTRSAVIGKMGKVINTGETGETGETSETGKIGKSLARPTRLARPDRLDRLARRSRLAKPGSHLNLTDQNAAAAAIVRPWCSCLVCLKFMVAA